MHGIWSRRYCPSDSSDNSVSASCCGLFLQEFNENVQLAVGQQVVWRIYSQLQRRQRLALENENYCSCGPMGNNPSLSSFLPKSAFALRLSITHAIGNDRSRLRCQHSHSEVAYLQEERSSQNSQFLKYSTIGRTKYYFSYIA